MKNQYLQDEGVDYSSHRTTGQISFHFKIVIKRGLELMASTLGSTFQKAEVEV